MGSGCSGAGGSVQTASVSPAQTFEGYKPSEEACSIPKIKDAAYGFNQNSDLVVNLPSPSSQCSNFCASAKSNSSPNTYSIDSAALISSGSGCSGAGRSVQTASVSPAQTFEDYQPPENACSGGGSWAAVDSDGKKVEDTRGYTGWMVCGCSVCGPGGGFYREDGIATQPRPNNYKYVFGRPANPVTGNVVGLPSEATRYNFATGMWCDDDNTRCEDYSENPG